MFIVRPDSYRDGGSTSIKGKFLYGVDIELPKKKSFIKIKSLQTASLIHPLSIIPLSCTSGPRQRGINNILLFEILDVV